VAAERADADNELGWRESGDDVGPPETRFARAGGVNVGYQVIGDGPVDLVWGIGFVSNIEVVWEEPSYAAFLRRLAEFSRVILFDRRGCGVSDRGGATTTATLEERVEDIVAVLDAVGSQRAALFGFSEGGSVAAMFASMHPERTQSVIIYGTMARWRKDADHPWGWLDDATMGPFFEFVHAGWGEPSDLAVARWAASMVGDARFTGWMAKYARQSVSRDAIMPLQWSLVQYDLIDVFPAVRVPALVLHRRDDALVPVGQGRWIAEHIPGARFVELAGHDHLPFLGESDEVLAEVEQFLVGSRSPTAGRRRLVTLLFTDIAGSTAELSDLGDDAWRELLSAHDEVVRRHLDRFGGREIKHLGDGFLAVFDGPARAIRCALGIVDAAAGQGVRVRAGVHTGECEESEDDVRGIAVHIGARIAEMAEPGEILVSSTVGDLVAGSGLRFGDAWEVELKGVAGHRFVFPVLRHGARPDDVRRLAVDQASVLRRDGDYWTASYGGLVATIRDCKGLHDIARLLAEPHREIHVLDLTSTAATGRRLSAAQLAESGLHVAASTNDLLIDDVARQAYKRRINELEQELDDADERGDSETAARARVELDALVGQLTAAYGLAGHARRTPDDVERARKAVNRRIRDAKQRVARVHVALGRHLEAALRTGTFCSYAPEHPTAWTIHM
jgi:pimeloyl-ACP methyl ester carboxylesterase